MRATLVLLACLALHPAAIAGNVLVVDASGTGNYAQIQAAVDAAVNGDTVLVKSGSYASFEVSAKALSVVGDASAKVRVAGAIRVRGLPRASTIVLANMTATGATTGDASLHYGLFLDSDQGSIRVQNCELDGDSICYSGCSGSYPGFAGVRVTSCSDVAFTACTINAGGPSRVFDGSNAALLASQSFITLYDCALTGSTGQNEPILNQPNVDGGRGGDGCRVLDGSFLFASHCTCFGGDGGNPGCSTCFTGGANGGDGGHGISTDNSSSAYVLNCLLQGGAGGTVPPICCVSDPLACDCLSNGSSGHAQMGNITNFPDPGGVMDLASPVREDTRLNLSFSGTPGDHVNLLIARTADHQFVAQEEGVLLLGSPMHVMNIGIVPADGILTLQIPGFHVGQGQDSITLQLQSTFTSPQGRIVLGSPSSLVVLRSAF